MAFTKRNSRQNKRTVISAFVVLFLMYFFQLAYTAFAGVGDFVVMALACALFFLCTYRWSARYTLRLAQGRFGVALLYHIPLYVLTIGILIVLSLLTGALTWEADGDWEIMNFVEVLFPLFLASCAGLSVYLLEEAMRVKAGHESLRERYRTKEVEFQQVYDQVLRQYSWPHFLNNTLAAIRVLTRIDPAKALEMISLTIDIMQIYVNSKDNMTLPLHLEVEQAHKLIKIYEIRHGLSLHLQIDISSVPDDTPILSMLLVSLVENACVHGNLDDPKRPAMLTIDRNQNGATHILFVNASHSNALKDTSSMGVGLVLIEERLATQYPGRYLLDKAQLSNDRYQIHIRYAEKSER